MIIALYSIAFWVSVTINFLVMVGLGVLLYSLSQNTQENGELAKELNQKTRDASRYYTMWSDAQHELNEKGEKIAEAMGRYRGHSDLISAVRQLRERCERLEDERKEQEEGNKPIWENPHD